MRNAVDVVIEQSPKRVRVVLGGQIVADTLRARLVWEVPHYPVYYLPVEDVRSGALTPSAPPQARASRFGHAQYFDVVSARRVAAGAAWSYPESPVAELRGLVRIAWDAMDAWFEEEDEVFVHPHDPYKRIDILHASRRVEVSLGGVMLADTRRPTVVYETGAPIRRYVPKSDVRMDLLTPTETRTGCAYKGFARYWSYEAGGVTHRDIAWSYPTPLAEGAKIAGLVAFFDEVLDVRVDGVLQERPKSELSKTT